MTGDKDDVPPALSDDAEARFHRNPELVARIDANQADPSRLVQRLQRIDPHEAHQYERARDILLAAIGHYSHLLASDVPREELDDLETEQASYARRLHNLRLGSPDVEDVIDQVGPLVRWWYRSPRHDYTKRPR